MNKRQLACASVALAMGLFASAPHAHAQISYQSFSLVSHARVHTRVEGVNDGRTVNQTHTLSQPLPPQRFNFSGPTVSASTFPEPSPLDARGTIFPLHVEMRPQLFDWGNDFFLHLFNEHSEQGRAQGQFDTRLVMTFVVATAQEHTLSLTGTAEPLDELPVIGGTFAYDFRAYRDGVPFDGQSRSAPPFNVNRTYALEPGHTYRIEYDSLAIISLSGLGTGGARLETGLQGVVGLLIQPVPEPAGTAICLGLVTLVTRRRGNNGR